MNKIYIIAEIGNTHEGSVGLAKQFIKVASECGVNAVKFQTHIFEAESLPDAPNPSYFKDETRKEYFERTFFNAEQLKKLKGYAENECNVDFISSPFSFEAVDLLEEIENNIYKIPSGEVNNIPYLIKIARTGKKVFLSSGMSSWQELDEAVNTLKDNGCSDITILQCTSEYPCPPERSGLNIIDEMKSRYGLPVGFSDHTEGLYAPLAAVIKGAVVIEKHFTLSKLMYGSDAKNSTEPVEFKKMVMEIKNLEKALNNILDKDIEVKKLKDMKYTFEKSIVSACDIKAGTKLTEKHLAFKKPGDGIPAREYKNLIGKLSKKMILVNTKISWDDVE